MARATLTCAVDSPEEVTAFDSWLERWQSRLTYLSEEKGCGCCVKILDVEGPQEVIDEIPQALRTSSDWSS